MKKKYLLNFEQSSNKRSRNRYRWFIFCSLLLIVFLALPQTIKY
jgi:hypothetical protein